MVSILLTGFVGLAILGSYMKISKWRQNHRIASETGFPVFYSPIYLSDAWWMMSYPILVPILELLPRAWTGPWLQIAQIWKIWKAGHGPFKDAGSDTFVLATPNGNMLWTCDNTVIDQLFTLHPKVEQPLELVRFYDLWGPTISSVSGEEWKAHRRAVSAGFSNAMNKIVWDEAQHQIGTLATHWIEK